ncbi:MAG: hypothetical protein K9W43_06535 [Candidatus Thorarchaeota archaeon]|nr:hypothetical protein [Candidatus Thorarchaeota archaeon]
MKTVTFNCPVCQETRTIHVDLADKHGIVSVSVSPDETCSHALLVFIDHDLTIRRIQRLDHIADVSFSGQYMARGMSLRGSRRVFGSTLIDIIASILQKHMVVLCDDVDVAMTLYNTLVRIFHEPPELGRDVVIMDDCVESSTDSLVVNCRYSVVVKGSVATGAHLTIKRFVDEAVAVNDNEAAIVFVRQRLSALQKAASYIAEIVSSRMNARDALKAISKATGIQLKYDDLHAILLILRSQGHGKIADLIVMGDLDGF